MDLNVTKTGFRHHLLVFDPARDGLYGHYGPHFRATHPNAASLLGHVEGNGYAARVAGPQERVRPTPLVAAVGLCTHGPATFNRVHYSRTTWIGAGTLTFIVRGDAYSSAGGSWTRLSIGLLNHGKRGHTPAYLWAVGMAVCGDKDRAALATIWAKKVPRLKAKNCLKFKPNEICR